MILFLGDGTNCGAWRCMQVGAAHAATQEAYSWMRKGICTSGTEAHPKRSSSQINSSPDERTSCSIIVELCPDLQNSGLSRRLAYSSL